MKLAIDKDLLENVLKTLMGTMCLVEAERFRISNTQVGVLNMQLNNQALQHIAVITELDVAVTSALAEECRAHLKLKDLNATHRNDCNT